MAPPLPSSDSKLVYYKVLPHSTSLEEKITPQQGSHALTKCTGSFNGDTILSSKYEIKEVGSIFWDVTATAVDNAWDLVRDLKLRYHGNEFETRHYRDACSKIYAFMKDKQGADAEKLRTFASEVDAECKRWAAMRDADYELADYGFWSGEGYGGVYITATCPPPHELQEGSKATFRFLKDGLVVKGAEEK